MAVAIAQIQERLRQQKLDGWLIADFHGYNTVGTAMLGIDGMLTRRFFYLIPANGEPIGFVHAIERAKFRYLTGRITTFSSYQILEDFLRQTLTPLKRLAMEYSPMGRLPYIGKVDAGTIEFVRSCGCEILSSADLVASFLSALTPTQMHSHRLAAAQLIAVKEAAFAFIASAVGSKSAITEFDVVTFVLREFEDRGLFPDHNPNCSVNANAGNPHYDVPATGSAPILPGALVLLDIWGKNSGADGVFADITWMAFTGSRHQIPADYVRQFSVLTSARDAAVEFLQTEQPRRPVGGYEVDDVCRGVIRGAGLESHFWHRTGHSIDSSVHGTGPNIDNLETEDRRILQTGHLFSIEPGLYFPTHGFRTEIDCLITPSGPEVTTLPLQYEITPLV